MRLELQCIAILTDDPHYALRNPFLHFHQNLQGDFYI